MNGAFALDGIELANHLGKSPGAQGSQQHNAQQAQRIRSEEGVEDTGNRAVRETRAGILCRGQAFQGSHEAALAAQHSPDDRHNTHQHDDALDKVVHCRCHIAADNHVDGSQHRHNDHADGIVNIEGHPEQTAQSVVQGRGIWNHEDKDNDGSSNLQGSSVEPLLEEVRHCGTGQMLRHNPGTPSEDHPGHQRTDQGVADTHPGGGNTKLPAELSGIADKNNSGEIGSAVSECGQPGAYAPSAEHKAVHVGGMLPAVETDIDHDAEENQQHTEFECQITKCHTTPSFCGAAS